MGAYGGLIRGKGKVGNRFVGSHPRVGEYATALRPFQEDCRLERTERDPLCFTPVTKVGVGPGLHQGSEACGVTVPRRHPHGGLAIFGSCVHLDAILLGFVVGFRIRVWGLGFVFEFTIRLWGLGSGVGLGLVYLSQEPLHCRGLPGFCGHVQRGSPRGLVQHFVGPLQVLADDG